MENKKDNQTDSNKESYFSEYDDGNIPEIDLPKQTDATNAIPDEMPIKNTHK